MNEQRQHFRNSYATYCTVTYEVSTTFLRKNWNTGSAVADSDVLSEHTFLSFSVIDSNESVCFVFPGRIVALSHGTLDS